MHGINTKGAFKVFANLTVDYALSMFDADTQVKVKKAWTDVGVLDTSSGQESGSLSCKWLVSWFRTAGMMGLGYILMAYGRLRLFIRG